MRVNFEIIDNQSLRCEGLYIDLHNNFDFVSFDYNVSDKEFKIFWTKSIGDWVNKNELSSLVLTHKAVSYLTISDHDECSDLDGDTCLSEITYFPSTAREINDSIIPQTTPNKEDDILFFFENGQVIRIHCEQIELSIKLPKGISDNSFSQDKLTEEDAFWIMFYFLQEHFELSGGEFELSDILSASQPFEFDENGNFDGQVNGNRRIAPADSGMIWHWNESVKKFREYGRPKPTPLKKENEGI